MTLESMMRQRTQQASGLPQGKVRQVGMIDLPAMAARLARHRTDDHYVSSASYYGFTGRHGLWMYEEGEDFIPFCLHPNVPGKVLIFPAASPKGVTLSRNLLQDYFSPDDSLQLARLLPDAAGEAVTRLSWTTKGYGFETCHEPVLDWLFPVHTLSTRLVAEHRGGTFQNFRTCTHHVDASRVCVEPLDVRAHYFDLMTLSLKWARARAVAGYTVNDLFEPHAYIIRMVRESGLDIRGTVVFMDDQCVAFAVWEMPMDKALPANCIASLSLGPSKGLPEALYLEMCRALLEQNIGKLCIGGSETAGLDAFKRKMNPVESLSLVSVAVGRQVSSVSWLFRAEAERILDRESYIFG